jgi:hypothetical protein
MNLDPAGVAAPSQRAALIASDVVAACLTALEGVDLGKPRMPNQFIQRQLRGPAMTSDERRTMYESWLLTRGFQDLARGIRQSLEEAFLYLAIIANPPRSGTLEDIEAEIDAIRARASKPNFPDLLAKINAGLVSPMEFDREVLSIQRVRNCLEHRDGKVGAQDLDPGERTLTLNFPRFKFFYMRKGEEIELAPDEPVDAQDGQPHVDILARRITSSKVYELGQRIGFTAGEFSEVAVACSLFATDLAGKLPRLP